MKGVRTRIKMCGMMRVDDINFALHLGVDAIGLIFYPSSPRSISIEQAKILLHGLPPFIDVVAVFVNPRESLVQQVLNELPIQYLQFHGEEPLSFCERFKCPYFKAIPAVSKKAILDACDQYKNAAALLLDTPNGIERGGSGVSFDWNIIPPGLTKPIILAGGLNSMNIVDAIQNCSPDAVDVCSGIEISPGVKNHDKMLQLVHALWVGE